MSFSARLAELLQQRGLARAVDVMKGLNGYLPEGRTVSYATVYSWMRKDVVPAPELLQDLADWLGVHIAYLHYGVEVCKSVQACEERIAKMGYSSIESALVDLEGYRSLAKSRTEIKHDVK